MLEPNGGDGVNQTSTKAAAVPILVVVLFAAVPATSSARTILYGDDSPEQALYQQWIDESHIPTPNVAVRLHADENCADPETDASACVDISDGKTWTMYINTYGPDETDPAKALEAKLLLMHEVGHVWDFTHNHDHHRVHFERIFQYPGWSDPLNQTWEKFATAYAFCAEFPGHLPPRALEHTPGYAYEPWPAEHRAVCNMLHATLVDASGFAQASSPAVSTNPAMTVLP